MHDDVYASTMGFLRQVPSISQKPLFQPVVALDRRQCVCVCEEVPGVRLVARPSPRRETFNVEYH